MFPSYDLVQMRTRNYSDVYLHKKHAEITIYYVGIIIIVELLELQIKGL
jgi:hypothetical protein